MNKNYIYIVYGVSGCGKTTVGKRVAQLLSLPFYDADDFHPQVNIEKMSEGFPLNDMDREPWLTILANQIKEWHVEKGAVLACSALKKKYRKMLQSIDDQYIKWIFLDVTIENIAFRLEQRKGHFFKKELLASQFDDLERPESGFVINANKDIDTVINQIESMLNPPKSEVGLIGLGVMGKSLATNLLSKGFHVSVYNRHVKDQEEDIAKNFVETQSKTHNVLGFDELLPFVSSIKSPRTIILMVNAGKPVDSVIEALLPILSKGDCIVDGGNSHYLKTIERQKYLEEKEIHFIGAGISGGEEGALKGPSIMPGGSKEAYRISGRFLEAIAAKDKSNNPCCSYVGPNGSGHYVKMIHNGIEYAEMQLLAEIYHIQRFLLKKTPEQISDVFSSWKASGNSSFLLEITIQILRKKENDAFLIDKVLDKAGQKGTGGWSTVAALEIGMPINTISEAVMARNLSGMKTQRNNASEIYQFKKQKEVDEVVLMNHLQKAFQLTSIINHAIGFDILQKASEEYRWELNVSEIARIWTNGCIIRSDLMEKIADLFSDKKDTSLLLLPDIVETFKKNLDSLTYSVSKGIEAGYPLPVMSAAVNYFLTYTASQSSANLLQAQRDYFGAHTYQRVDKPLSEHFHTDWKA
ncbi:NADP-dependent phosphogluconate dehydrogenase [Aquimarina algicola]|uniref:NADP-dependent phosphogluconate dehydrogenase n=1 Tax=Aquimarina algicola TaxID=2589995 RepID=UPI001CF3870B|nr:NADP-dependent phosphogluconate dehydrogenase [Aquimarina algicola]